MSACGQPGCSGTVADDGLGNLYCDVCGLAPAAPPSSATGAGPAQFGAAPPTSEASRATTGSSSRSSSSRRSVSGRLSGATSGRSGRSVSVRGSRESAVSISRARLGAGLVTVPAVPRPDPRSAVLENPEVPERKRFCSNSDCGAPVGRSRGDRPGRTEGFCTKCGQHYSFTPKLNPGDLVHGQYEVVGCLAHGGLGWIYLAIDHAVSDRWVVLKGLLDTGDADALAVAVAERRFLAEIEHPNIVRIINFVEHPDQRAGTMDGYIVMEYVGGKSLKEIASGRRTADGRRDPLPVEQAIAFAIEALDALGYLHRHNLLYCDFKVDNAIQQDDHLKIIDMGAVRRIDDHDSAIYGTVGYQAPEIAEVGPSVASDLYTVARTLAVLTFDFQGYTTTYAHSLPDPDGIEVFARYESFYRLLVRATDPDPELRFTSAEEMAEQLTGVLREVVAVRTQIPRPAQSTVFGPELRVTDTELISGQASITGGGEAAPPAAPTVRPLDARRAALALPVPRFDPTDPAAGFLTTLVGADPDEILRVLRSTPIPDNSVDARLCELRAHLELGALDLAGAALQTLQTGHPDDWRVVWYRGLFSLISGALADAAVAFDAVYDAFPGETAPKLALAGCAELLGQLDNSADYYRLVWTTDQSYVSAAFGLARVRLAEGDRGDAVRTLESVPATSIHYTAARVAAVRTRLHGRFPDPELLDDLRAAAAQLEQLELTERQLAELAIEVHFSALEWVLEPSSPVLPEVETSPLLGYELSERGLRFGLEHAHRKLARLAQPGPERIALVEQANQLRPRTWV